MFQPIKLLFFLLFISNVFCGHRILQHIEQSSNSPDQIFGQITLRLLQVLHRLCAMRPEKCSHQQELSVSANGNSITDNLMRHLQILMKITNNNKLNQERNAAGFNM
jgi:hypothetical protein